MFSQSVIYLRVSWNRLFFAVRRIQINIVPRARTKQNATIFNKPANKFRTLHNASAFIS